MTGTPVEMIQPGERRRWLPIVTLAFVADPLVRWLWPSAEFYARYWPRFAETDGGAAFDHGTAHGTRDGLAVAMWIPPGIKPNHVVLAQLLDASMVTDARRDANALFAQLGGMQPVSEHWFLSLIGVDPIAHGRGLGSSLIRHGLEIIDREGHAASVEATSPGSRDLYARHGFTVVGVAQAGSSPPVWAMVRPPHRRETSSAAPWAVGNTAPEANTARTPVSFNRAAHDPPSTGAFSPVRSRRNPYPGQGLTPANEPERPG